MTIRSPHARLDPESRLAKADLIWDILSKRGLGQLSTILDVGTGSGHIASAIGAKLMDSTGIVSVDVTDCRVVKENYAWKRILGTELPFRADSFDFAVSNHVIEHVGDEEDQIAHLKQIFRVLRPGGVLYLSVPNRWFIWERHFGLPFLSWLPTAHASWLVRFTRRGSDYDCKPLSRGELERMLAQAGFRVKSAVKEVISSRFGLTVSAPKTTWLSRLLWGVSWVVLPTIVVLATRPTQLPTNGSATCL